MIHISKSISKSRQKEPRIDIGQIKEGKLHGKGIRIYKDGNIVFGEFDRGRVKHGVVYYKNGDWFKGDFNL